MKETAQIIIKLIMCHLVGDYVLQNDFIARTKGDSLYHMFVHCALYCLPFVYVFGFTWHLAFIFMTHYIIDVLKATEKQISYTTDQMLHYLTLGIYLL